VGERSGIQIAAWALAAVLLVAAGWRLLAPGSGGAEAPPVRLDPDPSAPAARPGGRHLYVHVAGAVRRPGLYRVPASARVAAAVHRAGGPSRRADLTAVNLAAKVEDGQQVVVPKLGAAPAATGGTAGPGPGQGEAGTPTLSLATATVEQLDGLDGIGPTLAQRIIEYREAHGGFRSVEELREVDGIGEKRFAALKEAVRP
jgi:competence protein ComEA